MWALLQFSPSAMRDFSDAIRVTVASLKCSTTKRGECARKIEPNNYSLTRVEQKWIPMEISECESSKVS